MTTMLTDPTPLMQRPEIVARVIELIKESCQEHGWSIDSRMPTINNPDRVHVAHIRDQHGNAIGLGSARESNAHAICAAFQSAWATTYGTNEGRNDRHVYR
jgi:hypothetical protein